MKELIKNKFRKSNFRKHTTLILISFFLLIYSLIYLYLLFSGNLSNECISDECHYFKLADNILNGFYSKPYPDIYIQYGPGYPLFLAILKLLNLSKSGVIYINLILNSLTIGIIFLFAKRFINYGLAVFCASLWGFYFLHFRTLFSAHSEPFACFLFLIVFYLYLLFDLSKKKKYLIASGISLGFLVLTKVIFAYVILLSSIIFLLIFLLKKKKFQFINICLIAMLVTLPYQFYTYSLTGKIFYFSDGGGQNLYWMSNPNEFEYGEWNNPQFDVNCKLRHTPCNSHLYEKNHIEFYNSISTLNRVEKDNKYKAVAFKNIMKYPLKYIKNIASNISRLFFNMPQSYTYQSSRNLLRIFPNSILFTSIFFSLLINFFNHRKYKSSFLFFNTLTFSYLFLTSLLSTYPRMLNITLPYIFIWVLYSYSIFIENKKLKK